MTPKTAVRTVANAEVARIFREVADLLDVKGENPFRIRAYRTAARTIEELPEEADVANTRPLKEFRKLLHGGR